MSGVTFGKWSIGEWYPLGSDPTTARQTGEIRGRTQEKKCGRSKSAMSIYDLAKTRNKTILEVLRRCGESGNERFCCSYSLAILTVVGNGLKSDGREKKRTIAEATRRMIGFFIFGI